MLAGAGCQQTNKRNGMNERMDGDKQINNKHEMERAKEEGKLRMEEEASWRSNRRKDCQEKWLNGWMEDEAGNGEKCANWWVSENDKPPNGQNNENGGD